MPIFVRGAAPRAPTAAAAHRKPRRVITGNSTARRPNSIIVYMAISLERILDSGDPALFDVHSRARGPQGSLPITPEMLLTRPSGDLFGWAQNAGMGWNPREFGGPEILILSTHGGIRDANGAPVALGYHTGHWEV